MKLLSGLILVCLAFTLAGQLTASPATLQNSTRTKRFLIWHNSDLKSTARVIGQSCEDSLDEIAGRLNYPSDSGPLIPVYLYRNQGQFKEATGMDRPGQTLGRASSAGYIELDASGIFAPAEQVAKHEIVHVVIFRIMGGGASALPLWLNEGTAKYLSDDFDMLDRTAIADAVQKNSVLPLESISRSFPTGDKETLAYAEGTSAVKYYVDQYGEQSLAELIHATARTGSFRKAMEQVASTTPEDFERKWLASIEGSALAKQILRVVSVIGAAAFPVFIIWAYIALRNRRRGIMERYEEEEWEEANWRDWGGGN